MRRHLTVVGATLTACAVILGTSPVTARAATAQTAQADAALRYLYGQLRPDGSVAGSLGATEDTVISAADRGYDPATLRNAPSGTSAYDFLSSHASTIKTAGGAAKYILAWIAAGKPSAIDGTALLDKLNATAASGGFLQANGAFHNSDATLEIANVYSQSLAILADLGAGRALPANATGWLACSQRGDGGFGYAIKDVGAAPPASGCGDATSDTNDTAIVLQALGRAAVTTANGAAKTYLRAAQQPSGGFGFSGGGSTDPDSDAIVVQALLAIGQDPTGTAWTASGGGNAISDMESFVDPKGTGGYVFPGNAGPDAFTTVSVPQALLLKPYASVTAVVAGSSPPAATPPASAPRAVPRPSVPPTGVLDDPGSLAQLPAALVILGLVALAAGSVGRRNGAAG